MFCGNIFVVPYLYGLIRGGYDSLFGYFLFAAVLLHSAGAWLKRTPLQIRLKQKAGPEMSGWGYLLFLVLFTMHYGLFAACLGYGLEAGTAMAPGSLVHFIVLFGALFPTCLCIRALMPQSEGRPAPFPNQELAADIFIYLSLIIIFAFWEGVFAETLVGKGEGDIPVTILLVSLTTVPFSMFYLAPRVLFLVEDFRQPSTWVNAFVVMLPLSWRIMTG